MKLGLQFLFIILSNCLFSQVFKGYEDGPLTNYNEYSSSKTCFTQDEISYAIIGGIGVWDRLFLKDANHISNVEYPLGFNAGIFVENFLFQNAFIRYELLYQESISKNVLTTGYEAIIYQKLTNHYVHASILFKYQSSCLLNTYFLVGPNIGYLIKSKYVYNDIIYNLQGDADITAELPKLNYYVNLGFGRKLTLNKFSSLLIELRGRIGLNRISFDENGYRYKLGNWNNFEISFFTGIQLN